MKLCLCGCLLFFSINLFAQNSPASFTSIDWRMQNTDAPTPDSLGRIVASSYHSEKEKVRAVYSWIVSHVAYNTAIYKPWAVAYAYSADPLDTAMTWPSGDEMTARKAMRKRTAVCDGYSRLFKVVCEYAGIEAQIVQGYARTIGSSKFRTNHSWNAVRIDSAWHLLDVTWAAGHLDSYDDFVQQQNDFYFLTPPEQFINDHYPEELRWSLLTDPPQLAEFKKAPFRTKNFLKYNVNSYLPGKGVIEAAVGDTVVFSLQLKNREATKSIGPDPFFDTTNLDQWPHSTFLKPVEQKAAGVEYKYIVQQGAQWIHLVFNEDIIMRYRVKLKESLVAK